MRPLLLLFSMVLASCLLPAPARADEPPAVSPVLARACVGAAFRASGLDVDDARLDALVARARASGWVPEAHVRAMRLWTDADHLTTIATTDTASYYDAVGANFALELRLTWRLDRLFYAGDEPALERIRLEREEARAHVAQHVLDVLFAWQRARVAAAAAIAGSREEQEATLRIAETRATLDVLTGGWFSARDRLGPEAQTPPTSP